MSKDEMIENLINNMVYMAVINNRVIDSGGENEEDLKLAIAFNNNAITTFTNQDKKEKKEEIEDSE